MANTANDAGSKNWLKERAAISAAHRRQKTDPAVGRLIEKADQLHKERTHRNLRDPKENDIAEDDGEDIDAIVNIPPPAEVVVKAVTPKLTETELETQSHDKEASEDLFRNFAKSVLEETLTTESSLELSFDLKPEDIIKEDNDEEEDADEGVEGEERADGNEEGEDGRAEGEEQDKDKEYKDGEEAEDNGGGEGGVEEKGESEEGYEFIGTETLQSEDSVVLIDETQLHSKDELTASE
ncbi:9040_t:CDS:2 [Paraglomus occultum]|uniref:9040_t:CDS:1 n=1 Tax=Paraglomus occultum TaxID=144539 RepID=A0A9N9CHD8_9GLOM|nr:9040_t:CDS:2 [Paraglomus occultum]